MFTTTIIEQKVSIRKLLLTTMGVLNPVFRESENRIQQRSNYRGASWMYARGGLMQSVQKKTLKGFCLFHDLGSPVEIKEGGKISMIVRLFINKC